MPRTQNDTADAETLGALKRAHQRAVEAREEATEAERTRNELVVRAVDEGKASQAEIARAIGLTRGRIANIIRASRPD